MASEDLDPCVHGEMNRSFCPICANRSSDDRRSVYFTGGGMHFHYSADCQALREGQAIVRERGGTPSAIRSGYLDIVRYELKPCKTCATP